MLLPLLRGKFRVKNQDTVNVTVLLSKGEIERILWIAENVKDRAEVLADRIDVVYDAVQDVVREQRAAA